MDKPEDKARIQEPKPTPKIQPVTSITEESKSKVSLTKEQILDIVDKTLSDDGFTFEVPLKFKEIVLHLTLKPLDILDSLKIQKNIYKKYGGIKIQDFFKNYQTYQKAVEEKSLTEEQAYDFLESFEIFREYASDYIVKSILKIEGKPLEDVFEDVERFRYFLMKIGPDLFEVLFTAMSKNTEYVEALDNSKKSSTTQLM